MRALWREIQVSQSAVRVVPCASLRRTYLKENFFCEYEGKVDLRSLDESLAAIRQQLLVRGIAISAGPLPNGLQAKGGPMTFRSSIG